MAGMRVHELAKEFDMTSKELLARLADMKIPAKSHASILQDAYVEKIRKNLEPEIKQRAGKLEEEEAKKLAEEQAKEEAKKAEEAAARRAAVEKERAQRDAERARRESQQKEGFAGRAKKEEGDAQPAKKAPASPFESLASQIERERERVEREAHEARMKAEAETRAAEVAKKQAVAEALQSRMNKSSKSSKSEKKAAPVSAGSSFSSLLDQINNERERLNNQANEKQNQGGSRRGEKGKKRKGFEPSVPELEVQETKGEDRYAQMAVQAEKFQRDKVLAEARAAVEAASHEGQGRRKKRKEKREAEARERAELEALEKGLDPTLVLDDSVVEVAQGSTVAQFAELLEVSPNDIIKRLFMLGQALTLTQTMSDDLIELIADDLGRKVRVVSPEEEFAVVYNDSEADLLPRPPVVTVMGHVDHGKTSLLDAIRKTKVIEGEAGGITQHIGAYRVKIGGKPITFLDTPGHAAFTSMRARGAQVTDIAILVVAADDGVMPQTIEAINHAKAANVPIIVAVNKIDKQGANPDRVLQQLTEYELVPEEWGGQTIVCNISAKFGQGIDNLLEMVLLTAEMADLKANPNRKAHGTVIEAKLDKGRGPVATLLVQNGTLHAGDTVIAGTSVGRVRAMTNDDGKKIESAGPSVPVEIIGLAEVPGAGDIFDAVDDEKMARELVEQRKDKEKEERNKLFHKVTLDNLFDSIQQGEMKELNIIVKADVQGSVEAVRSSLEKLTNDEVRVRVIHGAVGAINESDVMLAAASGAIIVGFNVRPDRTATDSAAQQGVDMRMYRVIYDAIEEMEQAMKGMLEPKFKEVVLGHAEVRQVFKITGAGAVAGCYVQDGKIQRNAEVRVVRDGIVFHEGHLNTLKRFKDDVKEVATSYECGMSIENYNDIKEGDIIECFVMEEVKQ